MNFYDYLGVSPTATEDEIKIAFRTRAKQTHPDYNKDPNSFFQMVELNLIRDTLLDHSKRTVYDKSLRGHAGNTVEKPIYQRSKRQTVYSLMRELFIYRCRICGTELYSTWQGYCLYHFLEVTGQLNESGGTFTYHGQVFRWAPPPKQSHDSLQPTKTSNPTIVLYILSVITVIITLLYYLRSLLL